ncbi:hypothetical protein FRZ67_20420 [Panacibacter ginsenosidivorans]|uniref:Uncharacterized protein n=1 Tax=Panacibacter ginsenosidivorans TaxID=1813871 RepID=A0A5B8VDM9_9BACT|nr:hypothetical protein [Panacibacter ginsenosidivorans]QEC69550.1 hypothetical protein FRZ67_20420 [Panacibacter ginsenosidivorans]
MTNNTDEEHLDKLTNTQSENVSGEIIPTKDTEIINPNQETENMEVHHHPDLHHKPKKWKEYFLEFLMIFLAVTLGFIAENFREYNVNKSKEREFMVALKEDLISDTAQLNLILPASDNQFEKLDSLYTLLQAAKEGKPFDIHRLYYLNFRHGLGLIMFVPDQRTLLQIKNIGAFSLITNKTCRDTITNYDYFNNAIAINSGYYKTLIEDMSKTAQKIFNYDQVKIYGFWNESTDIFLDTSLPLKLENSDKALLTEYSNKVRSVMMQLDALRRTEEIQFSEGKNLIALLNKEYHLE